MLAREFRLRKEINIVKATAMWALFAALVLVSFTSAVCQDNQDTALTQNGVTPSTTKPAPVWQKMGNTGLPDQNWWIQFDHKGVMYVSSNNQIGRAHV